MLEPQLDHPSCHPVTGWFRASGEWEASDDVAIYLTATGRGNGLGIDWDYEIESVELFKADKHLFTAYAAQGGLPCAGLRWQTIAGAPIDISDTAALWMFGVAYAWTMKSASDWANKNAEPIPSPTPNED